jgi:hypothetical protein
VELTIVDQIIKYMVYATAPAQTLFILIYGFGSPWWRSPVGRALFTKALGLALLLDLALLFQWLGTDYWFRDPARLTVFGLILLGAWMQLGALLMERRAVSRDKTHRSKL